MFFFVLSIVCLYICVCECLLQNMNHKTKHKNNITLNQHSCVRGPLREYRAQTYTMKCQNQILILLFVTEIKVNCNSNPYNNQV